MPCLREIPHEESQARAPGVSRTILLRANEAQIGPGAYNMIEEFASLPQILAGLGYACGLSGKGHLGGKEKPQEGFTYWVTKPDGHTSTFYGANPS